jgi:hypothetical protein
MLRSTGRTLRQSVVQLSTLTYASHLPISTLTPKFVRSNRFIHTNSKTRAAAKPQEAPKKVKIVQPEVKKAPSESFAAKFLSVLDHNALGDVGGAVQMYEELKAKYGNMLELKHFNAILASFAPRKLMFGWFKPYKDYVDMYHEAAKFRPKEVRFIWYIFVND